MTNLPFLIREPEADYHAARKTNLTASALRDFRRCPLLYRKKQTGEIVDEDRPSYAIGRAAHKLILEGETAYQETYAVGGPINPKTGVSYGSSTKKYAEWLQEQGRPAVTHEEDALVRHLADSVHGHPLVGDLLAEGQAEGVVRVEYQGIECQGRIDYYDTEHGIIDLKTCSDLDGFEYDARKYGYAYQVGFYDALIMAKADRTMGVHIIAVEKKEPYRCGVWELTPELLDWACARNESAMEELKKCQAENHWPTGFEDLRIIGFEN